MWKWQATYLLFILPFIYADLQDIVKKECRHSSDSESFLKSGHVYKYEFLTVGTAASVGTTDRSSDIKIECSVTVSAAVSCLYNLEISNCKTTAGGGSEGQHQQWIKEQSLPELTEYPVLFSLNNGKLGSIFALPQDPIYSINIKRGIISGFSLSKSSADGKERTHRDVHGNCPRRTAVVDNQHFHSSKNMKRCQFPSRPNWKLSPLTLFWNISFVQHLIQSTVDCEYKVDEGQTKLEKVECHERHALIPHSSQDTAISVQTKIKYHLELKSDKAAVFKQKYQLNEMRATGIEMEYEKIPEPKSQPSNFLNKAQKILSDLVLISQEEVQLRVIPLFQDLLSLVRQSTDLIPFIDSVTACSFIENTPKCSKLQKELSLEYLRDVISQCNTGPCMKGFRHLVVRDQISRMYLNLILISWTNIPIPNPTYIEEILAICKHTEMKLCWLTLGTAIYKYNQEHSEIPQAVTDAVSYLVSYISEDCNVEDVTFPSDYTTADKNEYLLTVIKTIGNIGDAARVSHNTIVKQLYSCAVGKETSLEVSVAAIKAMYRMKPNNYIHKKLIFLMKDNSRAVGIRLAAYDILVSLFDDDELAKEIALLLREEKSIQVKCYIASDIQMIEQEHIGSVETDTFAHKLKENFKTEGVYLEDIRCSPIHHSRSFRESSFYDFHFLPKEIRGFGSKYEQKVIFETLSAIPYSSSLNYTIQIFNKYYNLFEIGMTAKNWEEFGIWIRRQLSDSNINVGQWLITNFIEVVRKLGIKGLIPVVSNYDGEELSFVYPDQKVADNLRKVVKQFFDSNIKQKPSLELYLKIFGNELAFVTLNGIFSFLTTQYHWISNQNIAESLRKGIQYEYTRSLKTGESYHLLPTMMGLPLSWGSNAIYVVSPRIKIDADGNLGERTENIKYTYSAAYTVIDSMILEFPTITRIGLQANTSMHTSITGDFTGHYSESQHLRELTSKLPEKKQKFFEFYRRNQEIFGDKIEDIPDYNIERKNDDWCTGDKFNEIIGFKLCLQRSYPNLPNDLKPSTFIFGNIESKYSLEKYDSGLKYSKLQIIKSPTNNNDLYDLKLKYKAPGVKYKREANAELEINFRTEEYKLYAALQDFPDFVLTASRTKIRNDDNVETGIKHHWLMQCNKDKKYEMTYNLNEISELKSTHHGHKGHKRSAKNKEFLAKTRERLLNFETPYNHYSWNSRYYTHHGIVQAEANIIYENLAEGWNWPAKYLPPSMWETDKKAWLHFVGEIEIERGDSEHFHRHIVGKIDSPKRSVDIVTHRMKKPHHLHLEANATVTEKPNGKYLSFINGTYHQSEVTDGGIWKRSHELKLMIPRYSWNIHAEREISDSKSSSSASLRRLRMIPKNEEGKSYIGEPIHSENFDLEEINVKYNGYLKHKQVENQLLPQKLRETEYVRNKDHRYPGIETTLEASLKFPVENKEESITVKGHLLRVFEKMPDSLHIFQGQPSGSESSITIVNPINNLRREIKTVIGHKHDWVKSLIMHDDVIYRGSDKKTEYNLNALWGEKEKCEYIDLKHNFDSSFFSFDSTILLECKPRTKAYNLEINMNTKSPEWDMLNSNTRQIFYLERHLEGWEMMNFSHPALKIDVEGKIGMDFEGPFYDKKYHIKSKTEVLPSAEISYSSKLTSTPYMELIAEIPEDGFKNIKYRTDIARDGSGFSVVGTHVHMDKPEEAHENFVFSLKLLTPFTISVKGYEDLKFSMALAEKIHPRLELLIEKIDAIRKDRNHPVNQLIKSLRKYTKREEEFYKKLWQESKENSKEIQELLSPFLEPTIQLIQNIEEELSENAKKMQNYESYTIAANVVRNIEYKEYAREAVKNLPHEFVAALRSYITSRDNNILKFHYTGPHPFYWQTLFQLPQPWEGTYRSPVFYFLPHINKEILFNRRYLVSPFHKSAMIFGTSHIYTFDGKMYEFPDFPIPDCTFMLAHDIRESTFSVLLSEQKLHLLFPEITVTLDKDKIYLNNSRQESGTPVETSNGKVSVTREGGIISVNNVGLKVLCDTQRIFCIFILDSLHHSGTMGLLGNADGEAFNDFTLPDGKHVETSAEMARGYEVSNRKRCRNIQEKQKPDFSKDIQSRCAGSFSHLSTACTAYLGIQDDLFTEACRWDVSQGKEICYSPDALAGYCTIHGMKQNPCSSKPNWYLKTVNSAKKLEVILIIEEHHKMFPSGLKGFDSLLSAIKEEFGKHGYDNIIYSVIGFGGKGIRWNPHINTPDSTIWHSQSDIISYMEESLKFLGKYDGNALEAIKYATTILPFDMQASRIMLLFTDHNVNSYLANLKIQYLKDLLDKYSLTLYTFGDFQSIEKGKKVFGLKSDGLVISQSKKESYTDYPITDITKLTAETHGSIFLKKFVENNEPQTFFKVAAEQFYEKVEQETSKCRKCIWKLNHWWDIQNECSVADECKDK